MYLLSVSLISTAMAAEDLEVALGGLNRHLITIVLIVLFAFSVITYWMGRLMLPLVFQRRYGMGDRLPPPPPPTAGAAQALDGFDSEAYSVDDFPHTDESTCIEKIYIGSNSGGGAGGQDAVDILDLELSRYIPGFRDEYFLVEVKDMWMKRFRAVSADDLDERFIAGLPMLDAEVDSRVEELDVGLVDSVVGFQRCELCVSVYARLRETGDQYRREIRERWTFVCEPQIDPVIRVASIVSMTE